VQSSAARANRHAEWRVEWSAARAHARAQSSEAEDAQRERSRSTRVAGQWSGDASVSRASRAERERGDEGVVCELTRRSSSGAEAGVPSPQRAQIHSGGLSPEKSEP
jgi:beta-galactosidase/beta-glucuronidase